MSVCVWVAGQVVLCLASSSFSLAWTHSVEKTEWVEYWNVQGQTLVQTQAKVKGSGAGMEPPDYARLEQGWWVWEPENPLRLETGLHLAASGATGQGWRLCLELDAGQEGGTVAPCVDFSAYEGLAASGLWLCPGDGCADSWMD